MRRLRTAALPGLVISRFYPISSNVASRIGRSRNESNEPRAHDSRIASIFKPSSLILQKLIIFQFPCRCGNTISRAKLWLPSAVAPAWFLMLAPLFVDLFQSMYFSGSNSSLFVGAQKLTITHCHATINSALSSLFFHHDSAIATTEVLRNSSQAILYSSISVPRL